MKSGPGPLAQQLVLAGGGHSHALVVRMLVMKPLRGVRVVLVSDTAEAPYSGMLPGHLAGIYSRDEIHIDLRRLCRAAGVVFILARVTGVDPGRKQLRLEGRPPLAYDVLSINTGSCPAAEAVPGVEAFAVPSKPVPGLLAGWEALSKAAARQTVSVVIAGGGAGGVELAFAMQAKLGSRVTVTVVHRGRQILETHNPRVRRLVTARLAKRGIRVITGRAVREVRADAVLLDGDGEAVPAGFTFWVTQAAPAAWIAESGLAVDDAGFLKVSHCLQSVSHPDVFAAGDAAALPCPLRRSGVYAVRMARPLLANLTQRLAGLPLRSWRPQRSFLSLIGTGDGAAVASRRYLAVCGRGIWKLKDWIDRRFMQRFAGLPPVEAEAEPASGGEARRLQSRMRCQGCAAKVGAHVLTSVMARLRSDFPGIITGPSESGGMHTGLAEPDDAAIFAVPPGRLWVQTVDYMPALTDDPRLFGKIAALHSFSDIFAMGAEPHSCLAAALLPFASEAVTGELLYQLLSGVASVLQECGAVLAGGHTAEGDPLGLALTCNGLAAPGALLYKHGLRPGDRLILTKPLGTGTLFAAAMRLRSRAAWMETALASMLVSNLPASRILRRHRASACTDVTGFGLAGHLGEMLRPSGVAARLFPDCLPALPGAEATLAAGLVSSLHGANFRAVAGMENAGRFAAHPRFLLLFDPQTSGGLLAGVPEQETGACLEALHREGCAEARVIGTVVPVTGTEPLIRLSCEGY